MRALFTVQPSVGHLHPLVPVARALSEAGHDVAVCSSASFRPEVEAFGLTHLDAGLDWLMSDQSTWGAFPPLPPPGPEFAKFAVTTLADITTGRIVPDLVAIAREWRPDLIVREGIEYGGCLAAERLGLPHASVAGNAYAALDSPDVHYFPGNRRMVAEPMVVVPITADQPYSAERCADLGVARSIGADDRTPETIRDAVRRVLGEPSYRAKARAFRAEMMALPGPDKMVELLEALPSRAADRG